MSVDDSCLVPSCGMVPRTELCRHHLDVLDNLGVVGHHCTAKDCDKPRYSYLKCRAHYKKWVRQGERLCAFGDCGERHYARELCRRHHRIYTKTGSPMGSERVCLFDGCGLLVDLGSYKWCPDHLEQWAEITAAFKHVAATNGLLSKQVCGGCGGQEANRWAYLYQIDGLHQVNDFGGFSMASSCYEARCLDCFAGLGLPDLLGTYGGMKKGAFMVSGCRTPGCGHDVDFAGFCTGCREQWLLEVVSA